MSDLRDDHDEKAEIIGGTLYRKGQLVRACFGEEHGRDSWKLWSTEEEAKIAFQDLKTHYDGAMEKTP